MKNAVYSYVVWIISLVVWLTGCTPGDISTATPTQTATAISPTLAPAPETSLDSDFPLTCPASAGKPDAQLEANLTPPEGTELQPNTSFRQTWRLQNTGDCAWPENTQLVLVSGNIDTGPGHVPVLSAAPGTQVDISVELTTPAQPGYYQSYWRLQSPQEQLFGDLITMEFTVLGDGTQVRTAVPPPTPHPTRVPRTATPPAPLATRFPASGSSGSCQGPDQRFTTIINQATGVGIPVTCATGPIQEETGAIQIFWQEVDSGDRAFTHRSLMIWQEDPDSDHDTVYVLRGRDAHTFEAQVRIYTVAWTPSMSEHPEACTPLVPPQGYVMPTRGIGKTWCEKSLWNSIGWPKADASPANIAIQSTSTGLLMEVRSPTGETYDIAIHLEAKAATVYQIP
jgi:hypothetical protein